MSQAIEVFELYSTVKRALDMVKSAIQQCRDIDCDIGIGNNPESKLCEARHWLGRAEEQAANWVKAVAGFDPANSEN